MTKRHSEYFKTQKSQPYREPFWSAYDKILFVVMGFLSDISSTIREHLRVWWPFFIVCFIVWPKLKTLLTNFPNPAIKRTNRNARLLRICVCLVRWETLGTHWWVRPDCRGKQKVLASRAVHQMNKNEIKPQSGRCTNGGHDGMLHTMQVKIVRISFNYSASSGCVRWPLQPLLAQVWPSSRKRDFSGCTLNMQRKKESTQKCLITVMHQKRITPEMAAVVINFLLSIRRKYKK